jgi:ankyrin repeat protein
MAKAASEVTELHAAVKRGDLPAMRRLLEGNPALANARSETDARGPFPLHVAAESGQTGAARLLLEYGADVAARDLENDAIPLGWAAFYGRPEVVSVLINAGSDPAQRNRHGLAPLGCAIGGSEGRWRKFSDASLDAWREAEEIIRKHGGVE